MSGTSLVVLVIGHLAKNRAILEILHLDFKQVEGQERGAGFRSQNYVSHLAIYQQYSISLCLLSHLCSTLDILASGETMLVPGTVLIS